MMMYCLSRVGHLEGIPPVERSRDTSTRTHTLSLISRLTLDSVSEGGNHSLQIIFFEGTWCSKRGY